MLAVWNASILEILWTLFGSVGVVLGWKNLKSSRLDIQALHEINGHTLKTYSEMKIIAYGHYRNNLFRLAKHTIVLSIGLISMLLPPANGNSAGKVTPIGVVITGGLFSIVLLLLMSSALDKRQREALNDVEDS